MGYSVATSCVLSILSVFLLLSSTTATINIDHLPLPTEVSPFCTKATTTPDRKYICTKLVNGATTWPQAMTNAINGVIKVANASKPKVVDCVEANLPKTLKQLTKESISSGCRNSFETYTHNLEKCLEFVKNDPHSSLEMYLSGNTFFDCKDGLDEFQLSFPEVNLFYRQTMKMADILVSIYKAKDCDKAKAN